MSPINYRPSEIPPPSGPIGSGSSTTELSHAGLSASVQGQLANRADVLNANQFFNARMANPGLLMKPLLPGAESAALAATRLPIMPGAEQISPMVQMIMRLPGHIGLLNSFFEMLGHMFAPATELLGHLDLASLAMHAQEAAHALGSVAGEHMSIDFSLLPPDAPILQTLGHAGKGLGEHAASLSRDSLNVSGTLDLGKPQFEHGLDALNSKIPSGKEIVSGPSMSDNLASNHLAGNHRLFMDQIGNPAASNNLLTSSTPAVPQTSAMNVNATPFGQVNGRLPADAQLQDGLATNMDQNLGAHLGSTAQPALEAQNTLGPSGAVSSHLGGQRLLASNSTPEVSSGVDSSQSFSAQSTAASSSSTGSLASPGSESSVVGLKAHELSLKGGHATTGSAQPVSDHIAHRLPHTAHSPGVHDQIAHRSINKVGSSDTPAAKDGNQLADAKPASSTKTNEIASSTTKASPEAGSGSHSYTIRAGDCLWNIAKDHLGSASKWTEIYKLNSNMLGSNPSLIRPGTTINLPGGGSEIASSGSAASNYVVHSGDNLWNIAKDHLGGGQNWGDIYKMNHDVIGMNPRLIHPGQELKLTGDSGQIASAGSNHAGSISPAASVAPQSASISNVTASPTPQAHPVIPAHCNELSLLPPAGAAEAAGANASQALSQASVAASNSVVSPSLKPDLSFLYRKNFH